MAEIDIELIKQRVVKGVVALTARTFFLQVVAFIATFLLTIFLSPEVFGIFYVVSAVISFLGYFSDIGLAAALVQKKNEITHEDLSTTFVIQQSLVVALVFPAFIFSQSIADFYRLDTQGLWLLRALILAFFLSSLKTIPSVLLERRLAFDRLVIPQIVETLGFYILAVVLAWKGFGIASFTWAVLVRGALGLVVIYVVEPWKPSFVYSKSSAKTLITFGLPFQMNSFLALLKDDLLTVFLGKVLSFSEVGYIGWAKKWAEVPLRLFMDSLMRVTFPAYSRLQGDAKTLARAIEKTLFVISAAMFPVYAGMLLFLHFLIDFIPKYQQWEPGFRSFYLFVFASILAGLTSPLMNALNATGRVNVTLKFMIGWTTATWILTSLGIFVFGYDGVAAALLLVGSSVYLVVKMLRGIVNFAFFESIRGPFVASLIQIIVYVLMLRVFPHTLPWLMAMGLAGGILFGWLLFVLDRDRVQVMITLVKRRKQ